MVTRSTMKRGYSRFSERAVRRRPLSSYNTENVHDENDSIVGSYLSRIGPSCEICYRRDAGDARYGWQEPLRCHL